MDSLPDLLTSDSEGSYAGMGSPRDLQSPDFTTGFHSDKTEVCFLQALSLPSVFSEADSLSLVFH